jgi:hypothetical protein
VVAKMGRNWAPFSSKDPVNLQGMALSGPEDLAADDYYSPEQEEEDEELSA